jgi:very-short-patch-repair endonuclease
MSSENNSLSYDDLIKEKARLFRNNSTLAENLFWNTLMRIVFLKPLTFNRQNRLDFISLISNVARFNW